MPWKSTGWTNDRNVTQMLEFLMIRGEVAIAGRVGRERLWDLAESVYPADVVVPSVEEATRVKRGRVVDLLLVERGESGELWRQLAGGRRLRYEERETRASGFIGGRRVRCASVALQLEHHDHPGATDQDRLDIEALERELRDNAGRGPHRERRRIQRG